MSCQVETYSGSRLHEYPRRFTWEGRWLEVSRVLKRWRDPDHLCFTVRAVDGRTYLLRYHTRRDAWDVRISGAAE
jgi:hypothetical protein